MKKIVLAFGFLSLFALQANQLSSNELLSEINTMCDREFYSQMTLGFNGVSSLFFSAVSLVICFQGDIDKEVTLTQRIAACGVTSFIATGFASFGLWSYFKLLTNNKKCLKRIQSLIEIEIDIKILQKALESVDLAKKSMLQQDIFKKRPFAGLALYLHRPYLLALAEIKGDIKNRLVQLTRA